MAPFSLLEAIKEVVAAEHLVEFIDNLSGAVLILFQGGIFERLKLSREVKGELQYLLKEEDPLDVTNVDILEALHDIVDFL